MADDKKTSCIKVWMAEPLELALHRLANDDNRKASEYIELVLRHHVFGHAVRIVADGEVPHRGG